MSTLYGREGGGERHLVQFPMQARVRLPCGSHERPRRRRPAWTRSAAPLAARFAAARTRLAGRSAGANSVCSAPLSGTRPRVGRGGAAAVRGAVQRQKRVGPRRQMLLPRKEWMDIARVLLVRRRCRVFFVF